MSERMQREITPQKLYFFFHSLEISYPSKYIEGIHPLLQLIVQVTKDDVEKIKIYSYLMYNTCYNTYLHGLNDSI